MSRPFFQSSLWHILGFGLLLGLLPTTALGMWLGTWLLVAGDVGILKRLYQSAATVFVGITVLRWTDKIHGTPRV